MWRAHLALLAVNFIYGANYIIAKGVMPGYLSPNAFVALRATGACILFWLIKSFLPEKVQIKDLLRLAACGLFGVAINQLLFFQGLSSTSPISAAIIMTFNPIMVLILAAVILKERLTKAKLLGSFLGLTGALSLIYYSSQNGMEGETTKGNILVLINAASYAMYLVLVKPLMKKYKPITVISYVFLFGSCFILTVGLPELSKVEFDFPSHIWWAVIYVVFAVTFLTYLLNIYALKMVSPTVSSSYIYLQPVISMGISIFASTYIQGSTNYLMGISWWHLIFTLLIFIGVYLVSKPVKRA